MFPDHLEHAAVTMMDREFPSIDWEVSVNLINKSLLLEFLSI